MITTNKATDMTTGEPYKLTEEQVAALSAEYETRVKHQQRLWSYSAFNAEQVLTEVAGWAARQVWKGCMRHFYPTFEQFELRIMAAPNGVDYLRVCFLTWIGFAKGSLTPKEVWLLTVEKEAIARLRAKVIPDGTAEPFYASLRTQYDNFQDHKLHSSERASLETDRHDNGGAIES